MIIKVLNVTWFLLMLLSVLYILWTTKRYKNKSEEDKLNFLLKQSIILCISWILYKVGIYFDKDYTLFEFWNELPFYPCNTMIWLSIIACSKNSKTFMSYAFYTGALCASLALLMPSEGFYDINFFTARGIGFYGTHWFVIITGVQFVTFGLLELNTKSCIKAGLCFLGIALVIHFLNMLLRATVYPEATYYYTYRYEENALLAKIYDTIPINYFYLIPLAIVGTLFFMLETVIINSIRRVIRKCRNRS